MTLRQFFTRITVIGLAIFGIAAALIIASSTDSTATQEIASEQDEAAESVFDEIFDETVFAGSFTGDSNFTVLGEAFVAGENLGQRTLTLSENFQTNRGQELVVNLRSDSGEVWTLGTLQAPSGAQAFTIPGLIDLSVFNEVEIFDQQLDVSFGSADLVAVPA